MTTKTTAYVAMRGSRSRRQVSRDASPLTANSTFPFAALVLGHPNGTSTRFELSYCEQALRETGAEGFMVDLTQKQTTAESVTLCRIFVPADGHGEPVPSYPTSDVLQTIKTWLTAPDLSSETLQEMRELVAHAILRQAVWPDNPRPALDDVPDNPGPWNDDDRHWFDGPFDTEAEAEKAFNYRMRTDDVPAVSTADASEAFEGKRS